MVSSPILLPPCVVLKVSPELMACDLDSEQIVLQLALGKYFSLNETGRRILEILKEPTTQEGLFEQLHNEYGLTQEVFAREAVPFLHSLIETSLITVVTD